MLDLHGSTNVENAIEGRVEVCYHNVWGSIFDQNFTNKDAAVVCHQLGYSRYGTACAYITGYISMQLLNTSQELFQLHSHIMAGQKMFHLFSVVHFAMDMRLQYFNVETILTICLVKLTGIVVSLMVRGTLLGLDVNVSYMKATTKSSQGTIIKLMDCSHIQDMRLVAALIWMLDSHSELSTHQGWWKYAVGKEIGALLALMHSVKIQPLLFAGS